MKVNVAQALCSVLWARMIRIRSSVRSPRTTPTIPGLISETSGTIRLMRCAYLGRADQRVVYWTVLES